MKGPLARYALTALVAFCAALAAILVAQRMTAGEQHASGELHALMHGELGLDPAQSAKVEALEKDFAGKRKLLDGRLRAANAQLAAAMGSEHQYGPKVAQAVDVSHMAMGDLQKATLAHVFAMRAVLRPDQAKRFDEEVASALTRGSE